jgi:hypothetical protein
MTIMSPQEVNDSGNLRTYLEDRLRTGRALSRRVASLFETWSGRSILLLPEAQVTFPSNPRHGGVVSGDTLDTLTTAFQHEIVMHRQAVICEHQLMQKGDSILTRVSHKIAYIDDDVYFLVSGRQPTRQTMRSLLTDTMTAQGFAAFIAPQAIIQTNKGAFQNLEELANTITACVIDIFDGETFMLWKRDK